MKPKIDHSFIILAVIAGFIVFMVWLVVTRSPDALAEEVVRAGAQYECAPWQDNTLSVTLPYTGLLFRARLGGVGMDFFRKDFPVLLDAKESREGMGMAELCDGAGKCTTYAPGEVELRIPRYAAGVAEPVRGSVFIPNHRIPVDITWKESGPLCA